MRSRTNQFCDKRESLTVPLDDFPMIDFLPKLNWLIGGRREGLLFSPLLKLTTAKVTYHMKKAAKSLGWSKVPSGHSGRVSMVVECLRRDIPERDIKVMMRWKHDSEMPQYYRAQSLETHKNSAPGKLRRAGFYSF